MNNINFDKKILIIGYGCVGSSLTPLLFKHLDFNIENLKIISKDDDFFYIAKEFGIKNIEKKELTEDNYLESISYLQGGDMLINVSVDISSVDLIKYCQENNVLYFDTAIEIWEGKDENRDIIDRTNYQARLNALSLKKENQATAVICHGANPGLVSHFVKQALINIATEKKIEFNEPKTKEEWAKFAKMLNINTIHIAEKDTQKTLRDREEKEFLNTWSAKGFVEEGLQPCEMGYGSHEDFNPDKEDGIIIKRENDLYKTLVLNRPGASIKAQSWVPTAKEFQGTIVTHNESISISEYFAIKEGNDRYAPSCYYVYHPCNQALESWDYFTGKAWDKDEIWNYTVMIDEIDSGIDELGVLLMSYNEKTKEHFSYWYGSQLDIIEARQQAPFNSATSLQVVAPLMASILWAINNPNQSIIEADEIDYKFILDFCSPYLQPIVGVFSDFKPTVNELFDKQENDNPYKLQNFLIN